MATILTEYPHILEMRERTKMFNNEKDVEDLPRNGKTSVGVMSHEVVVDLILKFFKENEYQDSYERLRNETKYEEIENYLGERQLETLVDCGLTKIDSKDLFNIPEGKIISLF